MGFAKPSQPATEGLFFSFAFAKPSLPAMKELLFG